jgi:hypothetical protein
MDRYEWEREDFPVPNDIKSLEVSKYSTSEDKSLAYLLPNSLSILYSLCPHQDRSKCAEVIQRNTFRSILRKQDTDVWDQVDV